MMSLIKLPKRVGRIQPKHKVKTDQEILDRIKLTLPRQVSILDASNLPHKRSPEYDRLVGRRDVQYLFSNSVIHILTNIDNVLELMVADCWEALKPFIPGKIFKSMFKRAKDYATTADLKSNPTLKVSEMTVIASILDISLASLKDRSLRVKVSSIAESLSLPIKIMLHRAKGLSLIKKEIYLFHTRFVTRYPRSLAGAIGLLNDFNASRCNLLDTRSSPFYREGINSVYFCFSGGSGYSVLYKSTAEETGLGWKRREALNPRLQATIAEGIGNEAEDRVSQVLTLLKGSLNRIRQVIKNPAGGDETCLGLEVLRLKKLFKFQKFSLPNPSIATIIFSFMRILSKLNLLEKILLKSSKKLKVAQKDFRWTKPVFNKLWPKRYKGKLPAVFQLTISTNWGEEAITITPDDCNESRLPSKESGDEIEEGQGDKISSSEDKVQLESDPDDTEVTDEDEINNL